MFYCEACRVRNNWPGLFPSSRGVCEECGATALCYDLKVSQSQPPLKTLKSLTDVIEQARARRDAVRQERKEQAERAKAERVHAVLDGVYSGVCDKIESAIMAAADNGDSCFHFTIGDMDANNVYMDFDDIEEDLGITDETFMSLLEKRLSAYLPLSVSVTEWDDERNHWGLRFSF